MDFQVNESTYFVDIDEELQGWRVFVKTPNGTKAVPVYVDEESFDVDDTIIVVEDKEKRKIVN